MERNSQSPSNDSPAAVPAGLREALCVFCGLFALGLLLLRPSIHGHDGISNFVYLQSFAGDRDLHFEDEYADHDQLTNNAFAFSRIPQHPATHKPLNFYGVGCALLWSPFYFAGYALRAPFAADPPIFESERFSTWMIGLGTLFWATLGLTLLYRLARRYYSRPAALLGLALPLGCSPLPFYIYFHPSMSHGCSFFAAALLVAVYLAPQSSGGGSRRWSLTGVALALAVMTRFQDGSLLLAIVLSEIFILCKFRNAQPGAAVPQNKVAQTFLSVPCRIARTGMSVLRSFGQLGPQPGAAVPHPDDCAAPAIDAAEFAPESISIRLANYACCAVAFLLAFLPQLFAWNTLHGSPFSGPARYLEIDALHLFKPVHFLQILFSSRHGLIFWHPLLLLGLAGLLLRPNIPGFNRGAWLAALLAHAWIIACWKFWWAGASFGHRMFIAILPLLYLGCVNLLDARPRWNKWLAALLLAGTLWNAGLIVQYGAGMIPREDHVPLRKIVDNQFRAVPKFLFTTGAALLLNKNALPENNPQ